MLNTENELFQTNTAKELMKGRATMPCVGLAIVDNIESIVKKCELFDLSDGCAKNLLFTDRAVSCPEGLGTIRILGISTDDLIDLTVVEVASPKLT